MKQVAQIMKKNVVTIYLGESVQKAAEIMDEHKISCLPVMEKDKMVGIITVRDIMRTHPNRIVDDAMTEKPVTVKGSASVAHAALIMKKFAIGHLPVVENGKLQGIVAKSDIIGEISKHVDALTELSQSSLMKSRLEELLRSSHPFSLIFIDLDNFSEINKIYGHGTGDTILVKVAEILKCRFDGKEECYLYRYGGDEFAVILENHNLQVINSANEIKTNINAISLPDGSFVSASLGIATCSRKSAATLQPIENCIYKLINLASHASTEAKKIPNKVKLIEVEL